MNSRTYGVVQVCVAGVCLLYLVLDINVPELFSSAAAFPFEQIGALLRWMSLSGRAGNAFAWVLYAGLCLSPFGLLWWLRRQNRLTGEAWLLPALSAVLFAVMYWMVNPGLLGDLFSTDVGKAVLGMAVWSVIVTYLILCILRAIRGANMISLQRYMHTMLMALDILFTVMVVGVCGGQLIRDLSGEAAVAALPGLGKVYLLFRYIATAGPYLVDIRIIHLVMPLLRCLGEDIYSEETVSAADKLASYSIYGLSAIVLVNLGLNLFQLLFLKRLYVVNISVEIPILPIGIALAGLLFARYIRQTKAIKDENELYI